jgi:hypothetical protein
MQVLDEVKKVLGSKVKGEKWVEMAVEPLVEVNREIKELEAKRDQECEEPKLQIKTIKEKYRGSVGVLSEIDTRLRERVMKEHEGSEGMVGETGSLVFAESWGYEVEDIAKVPKEYKVLTVDVKLVKEKIKNGVRKIPGLKIEPQRSLRVMTKTGS